MSIAPAGDVIRERLAKRGWTQRALAAKMGRPEQAISEIIHGKKRITVRTARELESVLGKPAMSWLKLDAQYRLSTQRGEQCAIY